MKYIVISKVNGKSKINSIEADSTEAVTMEMEKNGIQDYNIFCEINNTMKDILTRLSNLEKLAEPTKNIEIMKDQNSEPKIDEEINIELVGKEYSPSVPEQDIFEDTITFSLRFSNTTNKSVRAIKGVVVFKDLFNAEVFRIAITLNEHIQANGSINWSGGFSYNQFLPDHVQFRGFEASDLKVQLVEQQVIFNSEACFS